MVNQGDVVMFKDTMGIVKPALVQHVHGPKYINIIVISSDANKEDSYGRQIEHETSVPIKEDYCIAGRHFYEIEQPK